MSPLFHDYYLNRVGEIVLVRNICASLVCLWAVVGGVSGHALAGATRVTTSALPMDTRIRQASNPNASVPSFTFGAVGDFGANSNTTGVLDSMARSNLDFVQALGDLSYSDQATNEPSWCALVHAHLGNAFPFELVSGNHESGEIDLTPGVHSNGYIDNFASCLPHQLAVAIHGTYGKQYYYDYPASTPLARFILVSPNLTFTQGSFTGYQDYSSKTAAGQANLQALSSTIDSARAAGIPWVIVGMHELCITAGVSACQIGEDVLNLLIRKKVDLVLQGHDHAYMRSKQLAINGTTCTRVNADSTTGTTSSNGSENLNCVVNDGATGTYGKAAGTVLVVDGVGGTLATADEGRIFEWRDDSKYFATYMGTGYTPKGYTHPGYGFMKYTVTAGSLTGQFVPTSTDFADRFTITASAPTVSRMNWLEAHAVGRDTVVRWRSPGAMLLGFNVFGAGHGSPLNRHMIPALPTRRTYYFKAPGVYRYLELDVIARNGSHLRHRVRVTPTGR